MPKPIEAILAPKTEVRSRIYAYSIADKAHMGLLKESQTTRDVKRRSRRGEGGRMRSLPWTRRLTLAPLDLTVV